MYNPNYYAGYTHSQYPQQQPLQPMTESLTAEERKLLARQVDTRFILDPTPEEMAKAHCVHRDQNSIHLEPRGNNDVYCDICKVSFEYLSSMTQEEVDMAVKKILSLLQTTKANHITLPPEVARNYFAIIPYVEKLPQLFKIAKEEMEKRNNTQANNEYQANTGNMAGFNAFGNAIGMPMGAYAPPMPYGYPQQPMYQQPVAQPMYQQPMPYGYPQQPMYQQPVGNPFDATQQVPVQQAPVQQAPVQQAPVQQAPTVSTPVVTENITLKP